MLGLLIGFMATAIVAEEPEPATAQTASPDDGTKEAEKDKLKWKTLFDGKTLKNWKKTNFGGEGEVEIKKGEVILGQGEPLTGITWESKEKIPTVNYEFRCETRRIDGSDFFCALTFPVKDSHCSVVLGGWGGSVVGLSSIDGFDASENETTDYFSFDEGKWYKLRVRVTDDKIECWIDDKQIANVETKDKKITTRIEVDANRPLGFSSFMTVGGIKNIQLAELKAGKEAKDKSDDPKSEAVETE